MCYCCRLAPASVLINLIYGEIASCLAAVSFTLQNDSDASYFYYGFVVLLLRCPVIDCETLLILNLFLNPS